MSASYPLPAGSDMHARRRLANWLAALGIVAVVLAVVPNYRLDGGSPDPAAAEHLRAMPGEMPFAEEFRLGWAGSPLAEYRTEQTLAVLPGGGTSFRRTSAVAINWVSWSFLTLAAGAGLIWAASRLRHPVQAGGPDSPTAVK